MQKPKNTREWLIHITDQINMFRNWKEQEELVNHLLANDVVPVVRCSQCRKRYTTECALQFGFFVCCSSFNDDLFCAYGEKK